MAQITCHAGANAPCHQGCENCLEQDILLVCDHPEVELGRCLAVAQLHTDELTESYGAPVGSTIHDGPIRVYKIHGRWRWEYLDDDKDDAVERDQVVTGDQRVPGVDRVGVDYH
jgi:hypothetical protein